MPQCKRYVHHRIQWNRNLLIKLHRSGFKAHINVNIIPPGDHVNMAHLLLEINTWLKIPVTPLVRSEEGKNKRYSGLKKISLSEAL